LLYSTLSFTLSLHDALPIFTNNISSVILGKTGGRFLKMKPIDQQQVQEKLDAFTNKPVYIHLETTNGAYASHFENKGVNVGAYRSEEHTSELQSRFELVCRL